MFMVQMVHANSVICPAGRHVELRIHKGDHDVAGTLHSGQAFMVVSESSWMHERPAKTCVYYAAVLAHKPAPSTLWWRRGGRRSSVSMTLVPSSAQPYTL